MEPSVSTDLDDPRRSASPFIYSCKDITDQNGIDDNNNNSIDNRHYYTHWSSDNNNNNKNNTDVNGEANVNNNKGTISCSILEDIYKSDSAMKFRTAIAVILFLVSIATHFYQPWPVSLLHPIMSTNVQLVMYVAVLGVAFALLWSTMPKTRVDPTGKAVFITGCDSGFGNDLALRLDKEGYHVFAGCLAPDRDGAQGLRQATSDRLHVVPIDVTDDFQVSQAVRYVKDNIGQNQLWSVVNNAGVAVFCEIEWCSVQEFMKIMDVNVFGIVRVTKGFLPLLRQSEGRVINVASLAGRFTLPAFAAYSMSKKACIAFSDGLRQEMKKFNITVITLEPGLYKTPITGESYLIDYNRKSWAETPTDVKEDYGEEYFDAFLEQVSKSLKQARSNVQEVVDNMMEAVCSEHPSHRYVPYWKNRLRSHIIMSLPAIMTDKLFARRFHIKQPVARRNSKSPKTPKGSSPRTKVPTRIPTIDESAQF